MEFWKIVPIKPFDEFYKINNKGRIKSLEYTIKQKNPWGIYDFTYKERIKNGYINDRGYKTVEFFQPFNKCFQIHRLVALAFIPNPLNKPQVNHKNGIKTDNRVENLEWCTPSENERHAYKAGLKFALKGEKHGRHKLTEKQIKEIKQLREQGITHENLAKRFHVCRQHIGAILSSKVWVHIE